MLLLFAAAAFAYSPGSRPRLQQQEKEREKVLLISAKSAELIEKDGQNFRKVVGPAKFLHNDTYLLCDTALWNVTTNIIDAVGHVRIIQDRTTLSSATLQYVVDENMAKFRGDLVQLEDSDKNTLRTRYLDYNTKDSVAIFQDGAAMRDKDGQLIESLYGSYDSKARLFVFNDQVNMYMDTTFVKTSRLEYRSDLSIAYFGYGTDMWQDDKMLSAHAGWYDRKRELYFFRREVHLLTKNQEIWCDSLYYFRTTGNVEMMGGVELMDTTRNVYALAGRFEYTDSLYQVRMSRKPAVMTISEQEGQPRDTLFIGADTLLSRGIPRCDVPEAWVKGAEKRLSDISGDPVMEYRKKAAEEAARAAEEAAKKDPAKAAEEAAKALREKNEKEKAEREKARMQAPKDTTVLAPKDSLTVPADSLLAPKDTTLLAPKDTTLLAPKDTTLLSPKDTLPPPPDSTRINFVWGIRNVKLFRRDMQMASDSLTYTDLDSLVRVYQNPIFFNENGRRQYAADSIYMVMRGGQMQKAHLLSNGFITIQEAAKSFDQVRGAELVAHFDSTSALTRFDALGGASMLFYLEENGALATVNKVDSKMIYATFKDSEIERMYYYDNPKNDGYPTVQLPEDEKQLKGFRWDPERRPLSPLDITPLVPRTSERTSYLARPHAQFKQTETYFPGHVGKLYRSIAERDSLAVLRQRQKMAAQDSLKARPDSLEVPPLDSLLTQLDSLAAPLDSLAAKADSLAKAPADSLAAPLDSLGTGQPALTPEQQKQAEKEARKAQKEAERQARWAELDRRDAERQAAKEQKRLERARAKKLKALKKLEKKAARERKIFEKYLARERERALKQERKQQNL